MKDLVEHILSENYVAAQDSFKSRMQSIVEKKLYEVKRQMQSEEYGKEEWAEYRKKHPSFGMYDVPSKTGKPKKQKPPTHEKTASGGLTAHGIAVRKKIGRAHV